MPGGAGYVGAVLVPRLLELGYGVNVLDLYIYGEQALAAVKDHPGLRQFQGDIRDPAAVRAAVEGLRQGHPPGMHLQRPQCGARR